MPMDLLDGLTLAAVCERDDPRDAFISNDYQHFNDLPKGAVIGTSSLRRQCQVKLHRPDLSIATLRGNVGTRLRKLDEGHYDAIILAAAGLKRLNLENRIGHYFSPEQILPAAGQGAMGIECSRENKKLIEMLKNIQHLPSRICIDAERAMNRYLQGGCQLPYAAYATLDQQEIKLTGLVGDLENNTAVKVEMTGNAEQSEKLGIRVAEKLLQKGAHKIIQNFYKHYETD